MKTFQSKKIFLFLLLPSFLFNFLPSPAKSNFKPPILNSTDLSFNGPINAIAVDEMTGVVYVGGAFTKVGEIERNHLAAIGPDGTLLGWNPNVNGNSGVNTSIYALAISGSTIYVGGDFTKVGETARNNLAAIGPDGTCQSWNPNANDTVSDLKVSSSILYVAGVFTKIGEITRNNLAAITTNGSLTRWNPNVNGPVNTLAINDSTIYVGGHFTKVKGKQRNNLAAITTNGSLTRWNPNISNLDSYTSVNTLAINDSTIYVGGQFTKSISKTEGMVRNNLVAIGIDSTLLDWSLNINGPVNTLAIKDSTVYIGGKFTLVDNKIRSHFASFSIPDGTP